ncbi:GNAT family N-acetyltransferase [Primorskyibacter sp. 2E233]|uniref:GNAT family N-acetyltransferase n=1 Tax=Primorskyibacter sp. 2E233 TaxID=3413431 RepID=UPI003BF1FC1E
MTPENEAPAVRRATQEDMPALLQFVGETYGAGAPYKDRARHHWQFEDTPFKADTTADPTIWLAEDGGRIIGTIAVQDGALWVGGRAVPASWIVDVMVHPEARGRGLSHRIHDRVIVERKVLVTLTMAAATRRVAERAGCLTLGPVGQFILPHGLSGRTVARFLKYKSQFGSLGRRRLLRAFVSTEIGPWIVAALGRATAKARRLSAPKPSAGTDATAIREVSLFPDEIDTLWQQARPHFPVVFERSAQFLNWRFVDCPGLTYRRFLLYRGDALAGYLVTRVGEPEELPLGVVADAFALPDDPATLDALLAHAVAVLAPESDYLEAAASHPAWQQALRRAGFLRTRTMRPTVVCTDPVLRDELASFLDDWHFTKADHDWDQVHPV